MKLLLISMLSAFLMDASSTPPTPITEKVLIVGDSEACAMKYGAVAAVKKPTEKVDIVCVGGTRVAFWNSDVLESALKKDVYDSVIVFLGTNDFGGRPMATMQVIDRIKKRPSVRAIVWMGPPKVHGKTSGTNRFLKQAVVASGATYVDVEAMDLPLADGVHPTGPTSIRWLSEAWKTKNSLLTIPSNP